MTPHFATVLVSWRNLTSTMLRILSPPAFLLLLYVVVMVINYNIAYFGDYKDVRRANEHSLNSIPRCENDDYSTAGNCYDFLYTPSDDPVVEVSAGAADSLTRPLFHT